jgi:hypothetical protein
MAAAAGEHLLGDATANGPYCAESGDLHSCLLYVFVTLTRTVPDEKRPSPSSVTPCPSHPVYLQPVSPQREWRLTLSMASLTTRRRKQFPGPVNAPISPCETGARCGNLTGAARLLRVRQPTLSISMQRLEAEVGTTRLVRDRSGVTLTSTGKTFLQYVHDHAASPAHMRAGGQSPGPCSLLLRPHVDHRPGLC